MGNENDVLKEMMLQQQAWASKLLADQKQWMQSMLEKSQAGGSSDSNINVPSFHSFTKEIQPWESYLEQLEQHFTAYAVINQEKKKSFFLSWSGEEIFELLKKLFGGEKLFNKTYKEVTEKLTEHFVSKVHVIAARYEFHNLAMKPNQTYREWVAELRGIARNCKFTCGVSSCATEYTDEMIRDMIILNTPHDSVRISAMQKLQPTLAEVLLMAESYEATTKNVQVIKENNNHEEKEIESFSNINVLQNKRKISKRNTNSYKQEFKSCTGCGISHERENCRFRFVTCHQCKRKGHIAAVCLSKKENNQNKFANSTNNIEADDICDQILSITGIVKNENNKMFIDVQIAGTFVKFQLDSGASVSVITKKTYDLLKKPQLEICKRELFGFGHKRIKTIGELKIKIKCGKMERRVPLVVTDVDYGNNLFGADLFKQFGFTINQIDNITDNILDNDAERKCKQLCEKYNNIFGNDIGTIKSFQARIYLKSNATPKFYKSRSVPFAQLPIFNREAERMVNEGIWKPIQFSDWASPIVLITKQDGSLRICGDFKVAVNNQIDVEKYPLPTRESLFHKIRYGKYFSKLDLKEAYLQMELEESSKSILVVNTPAGLFQYQRMPYGIASAPAIFQRYLEQLLQGIEGCGNYLDDIIISAPTIEEHVARLEKVLAILSKHGIKCKKSKCKFIKQTIEYLGRQLSATGILPDEDGVRAVKYLRPPRDLKEVEAFIGKVNYYNNFIPNFSQIAAPINQLRRKNAKFEWGKHQQDSFQALKDHIVSATEMAHFQEHLPIILATDASSYGIGAVISHLYADGTERPIAFASKTLDQHQEKYSQIEKEALSIVFGVQRFHTYLYGRKFILITDHKPLVTLFSPNKQLPTMTAHRIQRWAIILMAYQFEIKYRRSSEHGNADALSRLPIGPDPEFDKNEYCNSISEFNTPINIDIIRELTLKDEILQKVKSYVEKGWPQVMKTEENRLRPFFNQKFCLVLHNDVLFLQTSNTSRVIIPSSLKVNILNLLHDGHWGIVKMKRLARQHCWWVTMDKDIEEIAAKCEICKVHGASPAQEFSKWPDAIRPWQRVHIDFAGPIFGSMWLICVDAYSQYPFICQMTSTTSTDTVSQLSGIFSIEGLPETLVSDNGPQLTSDEFQEFCLSNGIQHVTTAPFHPASNGLAERFVRTFKTSVAKNIEGGISIKNAVLKYLSTYRSMPNHEGKSPSELLHGRKVRTLLTQLPSQTTKQEEEKVNNGTKYKVGESVFLRNYGRGPKWIKGTIEKIIGNMVYIIKTEFRKCKRHQNQVKPRVVREKTPNQLVYPDTIQLEGSNSTEETEKQHKPPEENPRLFQTVEPEVRRSQRTRIAVDRFHAEDFRNKREG